MAGQLRFAWLGSAGSGLRYVRLNRMFHLRHIKSSAKVT